MYLPSFDYGAVYSKFKVFHEQIKNKNKATCTQKLMIPEAE
jgi:hypothetical protein